MKTKAFTLVEMVIVLLIMGMIVILFTGLTGNQVQKLQQKTVKEQILSEYLIHYSKNLTSSIYGGSGYDTLKVSFQSGDNTIIFDYLQENGSSVMSESIIGDFVWEKIISHPDSSTTPALPKVDIVMTPYEIACTIGETFDQIVLIAKIKDQEHACFEIKPKSCRMREIACRPGVRFDV